MTNISKNQLNCDECGAFCKIIFELVDEDEFHDGTEKNAVGAECSKCGWSIC